MTSTMRPDEQAAYSEIERSQTRDRTLKSGLKTAATAAVGFGGSALALGGKLGSKIMPFLNEYIPADLAMKGINKVSPRLGEFLKKGMSKGLNLKDGLEFIKENLGSQKKPKEQKNILEQYSPELNEFIKGHIQKGRAPLEAAALATIGEEGNKFNKIIQKMAKDHKTSFSAIIQSIFGAAKNNQQPQLANDVMNPVGSQPSGPPSAEQQAFTKQQQNSPTPPQQQGKPGAGQQALMSILQKIQQTRGGQI